jgi:hypothetical protein
MHSKAVYLAVLLLVGCGGSDGGSVSAGASASSGTTDPAAQPTQTSSTPSESSNCKDGLAGTIVGGDLFVAEQGPVGMTLLSNGGLSQYLFWVLYDNVFGIPAISNRQDKFGAAQPFPPGTPPGAASQLQLQPPSPFDLNGQTVPTSFPKGVPVELLLRNYDGGPVSETNTFTTAAIGKDIWPDGWPRASVTYGPNNTATVTFFSGFSVGLANVCGSGSAL